LVSDKLDDVAKEELKVKKLPRSSVKDMLENDVERLIAYNIIDVYLTSEINHKNDVIRFHQTLAELAGTDLDGVKYNASMVDSFLLHFVGGKVAIPSRGMLKSKNIEAGGRVHDAITGVRKNVAVVDLSRAYPTTIQVNNLSPETKMGYACDICNYSATCEKKQPETPGCEKFCCHTPHIKKPSGRCYRKDIVGLIPAVFIQLIEFRKKFQAKMKDAIKDHDKEMESKYYEMQRAVKYLMNSFYGVLGSIDEEGYGRFRLADGEIGSDVTQSIRMLNRWMEEHIGNVGLLAQYIKPLESDLYNEIYKDKKEIVPIYADTDSVLFTVPFDLNEKEKTIEKLKLINELLNRSFKDFARKLSGTEQYLYEVEFEKLYETFFQGGKKKKYAGLFAWKKGVWMTDRPFIEKRDVRGYELRRSDASKFTKEHQEKLFEIILTKMDRKEVAAALQQWKEDYYSGKYDMDLKMPKGISKVKYEKTIPMQLRAASYANKFLGKTFKPPCKVYCCYMSKVIQGPGIEIVALDIDDNPSDFGEVDYNTMFEKQFQAPFERITEALGWSWNELMTGMFQGDLEEFF